MRVLHLFSNSKWTGPAEPALNLCVALRRIGIEADFACAPNARSSVNKVVETARDRGIEPILRFSLPKYRNPVLNLLDSVSLDSFLRSNPYSIIHCHLDNDHRISLRAARKHGIPIVRSSYYGTGFPNKRRVLRLLKAPPCGPTARILQPSQRALDHDAETFGFPRERMAVIPNAVDTERFDPSREVPDGRRWLRIPPGAFVVGIVARMQPHRRYEDLFRAARRLVDARDDVHVIVVGRGSRQDEVAILPVRELGIQDRVHFPGFVDGENYVGMLKAFDVKVFLVPGTDGACRAVREAMAMAKPAVVADRGMLAEIVDHEANGLVCDGSPDSLFEALHRLAADRPLARAFGRAAREKAVKVFSLDTQARAVAGIYEVVASE